MNKTSGLIVAFDGDDTLWDNQIYYDAAEERAKQLFSPWLDPNEFSDTMLAIETRRVELVGFGAQSFSLSLLELAAKVAPQDDAGALIPDLIKLGEDIVTAAYTPLPGAKEAVTTMRESGHRVVLITKGNQFEQRQKFHRNGFVDLFDDTEIVPDKTLEVYQEVANRYRFDLADMVMVGNSIKSDINPLIGHAKALFYIPYHTTWRFEQMDLNDQDMGCVTKLASITELAEKVRALN